jgi:hypothetical protein
MDDEREDGNERSNDRIVEQIQFNLIFAATFVAFVGRALLTLLLPWTWRRGFLSEDRRWFIRRAWDDAATFIELAYMG